MSPEETDKQPKKNGLRQRRSSRRSGSPSRQRQSRGPEHAQTGTNTEALRPKSYFDRRQGDPSNINPQPGSVFDRRGEGIPESPNDLGQEEIGSGQVSPRLVPSSTNTYDSPGSQDSASPNSGLRGEDESSSFSRLRDSVKGHSPSELKGKESAGGSGALSALGKEKGLFTGAEDAARKFGGPQARIAAKLASIPGKIARNKKKSAAGGIAGVIAGGLVFLFTIGQGPLQLIHLSQLLQKNFFGTEKSSSLRMKGLFRYHRTGDIGETRVSKLGSEVFKKTVTKLEGIGFDFSDRNQFTGHLKSVTIDPNKHPAFKDLPAGERRAAIIKHFGIQDSGILSGSGNAFKIDLDSTSVKGMNFANSLAGTAVGDLQDGKILTGMGARSMKKFYNLPRLFSPLEKRAKALENKLATKAERKKAETERSKAINESSSAKGADARNRLKGSLSGAAGNAVAGALVTTEALCLVREVADDVVMVNRFNIVIPSILQAVDKTAVGAQVQSGDLRESSAGQVAEGFIDENGQTIWNGKAMQALSGKSNLSGEEISDDYKQAFSNETTAQKLKDGIGSPTLFGKDLGGAACSKVGILLQGAASIALLAAGPITLGGSWGVFAAKAGAGAAAAAGAQYLLKKLAVSLLKSDSVVPDVFAGPLGGNLLAYGGREAGNVGARSFGAIAMGGTTSVTLDKQQEEEIRQEFQSKSFIARLFDVYDHRSLAGNFIDNTSASTSQNINTVASSLANFGSLFSGLFSTFMPRAYAASEPYDWAFPKYGINPDIFQSPEFEDPYVNAIRAAELLDGGRVEEFKDRAKKCFGVDINNTSGVWDAIAVDEVNPNGPDYEGANCNDPSGEWKRIYTFVFDTRLLTATACYEGDEEACNDVGAGTGSNGSAETPSDPTTISGDAQELAQQILDNNKITKSGRYVTEDFKNTAAGKPAFGSVSIDINLLKFLAELGQTTPYTITSLSGAGSGHSANSKHYRGEAVDFGCGFNEAKADQIGKKYGLLADNERCDNGVDHSHFSADGF